MKPIKGAFLTPRKAINGDKRRLRALMHFPSLYRLTESPTIDPRLILALLRVTYYSNHGFNKDVSLFPAVVGALRMQDQGAFCGGEIACSGRSEGGVGRGTGSFAAGTVEVVDDATGAAYA